MKKRVILLCMVVSMMFLLSGCGKATVTSELKFNTDGSGSRSVYATIAAEDAAHIEGGVEELDCLLQDAAPEGVTIRRTDADNGDEIYQFTFFFDNIDQYNQKISQITGKEHQATWYTSSSVFSSNIEFTEDDCTTDLIQWAVDAIKDKVGGWAAKNLNYEVKKNDVYYDNTLQYSGTDNPKFVIDATPKVSKVSVYTTFSFDGSRNKKIEVQFEKGGLDRVNLTDAKSALSKFATNYSFDRANNIITYDLKNEEIDNFLMAADSSVAIGDNKFEIEKNPFQEKFEIYECYNLKGFFSLFDMSASSYIYDYVKLPALMNDVEISHTDTLGNVEVPEGYDIAGAYSFEDSYTASFVGDQKIDLKEIKVDYVINNKLGIKREIGVTYIKNGCDISKEELAEYYKDYKDTVSLSDNEETIKVTFMNNSELGTNAENEEDKLSSFATKRGIKFRYYTVEDDLDITRYLPNVEGYEWNKENIEYAYTVQIEKDAGVSKMQVQNLTLTGESDLSTAEKDAYYEISGKQKATENLKVNIQCEQIYDLFYFYIILIVFVVIIGGLIGAFIFLKKKKIIEKEDYDDLDKL